MSQSIKERIQMAHATLTTLQNGKLLFAGVDLYYMKMVSRTLIQSKMDYAVTPVRVSDCYEWCQRGPERPYCNE